MGFAADIEKRSCDPLSKIQVASETIAYCSLGATTFKRNLIFNAFSLAKGWEHQIPGNRHVRSVCLAVSAVTVKVLTASSLSSAAENILHI